MDRKWGLLIIISGLILLIIIIYFIFFHNFGPEQTDTSLIDQPVVKERIKLEPTPDKETIKNTPVETKKNQVLSKEDTDKISLTRLAQSFAERYGSFSNQSDFGNVRDLEIFMTDRLRELSEEQVNEQRAKKTDYESYSGVTTKALSSDISYYLSKQKAEVVVKTRKREKQAATGVEKNYSQSILMKFVYENGSWKVDEAIWQQKTD